jgi:hypothetical protein
MMERDLLFDGTQRELSARLRLAAHALDLRIGENAVAGGTWLAAHPDELSWSAQVTLADARIVIRGISRGAPWSRRKRERMLALRLDELTECLAGEQVSRRKMGAIGPGTRGLCTMLAWAAGAVTVAVIAALIPLLMAGLVLVDDVVDTLVVRAGTLERIGALPLPSPAELDAADGGFRAGAALILMLPVAFLVGSFTALVHGLGEIIQAVSRWTAVLLMPLWALLLAGLWSAMAPFLAALLTAVTACSTFSAVSFLWSRRREVPAPVKLSAGRLILPGLSIVVLLAILISGTGESRRDRLGTFRDQFLLPTGLGRAVATFYYRHTLYAAETYKPTFSNPFTERRRDPGFLRSALTTRSDLPLRALGIVAEVCSPKEAHTRAFEGRHDFYLLPNDPEWAAVVDEAKVSERTVFVTGKMTARDLAARLDARSSEATGLRAITAAGWNAALFCGPAYALLLVLGIAGVAGLLLPRAAPVLLVGGQLFLVLGVLGISAAGRQVRATQDQERLASYLRDPDAGVRAVAASHAARLLLRTSERRPKLSAALVAAVHDDEVRVRTWAVLALARYGGERAVPELLGRLHDDALLVRYRAAAALRSLDASSAWPHLEERLREDSWYVGMHALAALRRIDSAQAGRKIDQKKQPVRKHTVNAQ